MNERNSLQALQTHLSNSAGSRSLTLSERNKQRSEQAESNILLLDISGSMGESVNKHKNDETRIDVLWSTVQRMRSQNIPFRVCEFSSEANWSDGITKPEPYTSTDLANALQFIRTNSSPKQITLITDGYPDYRESALLEASKLTCPINVLYVGPDSDMSAIAFCQELSAATNGRYAQNNLSSDILQLAASQTTRLMLQAGTDSSSGKKGQINL